MWQHEPAAGTAPLRLFHASMQIVLDGDEEHGLCVRLGPPQPPTASVRGCAGAGLGVLLHVSNSRCRAEEPARKRHDQSCSRRGLRVRLDGALLYNSTVGRSLADGSWGPLDLRVEEPGVDDEGKAAGGAGLRVQVQYGGESHDVPLDAAAWAPTSAWRFALASWDGTPPDKVPELDNAPEKAHPFGPLSRGGWHRPVPMQASVSGLRLTSAALQPSSLSATLTVLLNPDSALNDLAVFRSEPYRFDYYAPPLLHALRPTSGPAAAGSRVVLEAHNLDAADAINWPEAVDARCRFGDLSEVSASFDYTNASYGVPPRFECVAPTVAEMGNATEAAALRVRLTLNGQQYTSSALTGLGRTPTFTLHPAAAVRGVEPGGGPVDGGTLVEVRGAHFAHGRPTRYRCRFGAGVSPASYDAAAGSLRCVAPPQRELAVVADESDDSDGHGFKRERAAGVRARRCERVGGACALPAGGGDGGRVERDAHEAVRAAAAGGAPRRGRARGDAQRAGLLAQQRRRQPHLHLSVLGRAGAHPPRAARRPRARRPPRLAVGWQLLGGHHLRLPLRRVAGAGDARARGGGALRGARGGVRRRRRRAVPRLFRGVADDAGRRAAGARPPSGADAAVRGASGLHPAGGEEADRAPHHRRARGAHARRRAVCGRADRRASRPVWRAVPDGGSQREPSPRAPGDGAHAQRDVAARRSPRRAVRGGGGAVHGAARARRARRRRHRLVRRPHPERARRRRPLRAHTRRPGARRDGFGLLGLPRPGGEAAVHPNADGGQPAGRPLRFAADRRGDRPRRQPRRRGHPRDLRRSRGGRRQAARPAHAPLAPRRRQLRSPQDPPPRLRQGDQGDGGGRRRRVHASVWRDPARYPALDSVRLAAAARRPLGRHRRRRAARPLARRRSGGLRHGGGRRL